MFSKRFYDHDHYYYTDNVVFLIVTDVIASKIIRMMVKTLKGAVTNFSSSLRNLEVGVRAGLEEGAERVAMMGFRRLAITTMLEEVVMRMVMRAALEAALAVFVRFCALVAIDIVGTVLGIVLDLALKLNWYDNEILTDENLQNVVAAYKRLYERASSAGLELGAHHLVRYIQQFRWLRPIRSSHI